MHYLFIKFTPCILLTGYNFSPTFCCLTFPKVCLKPFLFHRFFLATQIIQFISQKFLPIPLPLSYVFYSHVFWKQMGATLFLKYPRISCASTTIAGRSSYQYKNSTCMSLCTTITTGPSLEMERKFLNVNGEVSY